MLFLTLPVALIHIWCHVNHAIGSSSVHLWTGHIGMDISVTKKGRVILMNLFLKIVCHNLGPTEHPGILVVPTGLTLCCIKNILGLILWLRVENKFIGMSRWLIIIIIIINFTFVWLVYLRKSPVASNRWTTRHTCICSESSLVWGTSSLWEKSKSFFFFSILLLFKFKQSVIMLKCVNCYTGVFASLIEV